MENLNMLATFFAIGAGAFVLTLTADFSDSLVPTMGLSLLIWDGFIFRWVAGTHPDSWFLIAVAVTLGLCYLGIFQILSRNRNPWVAMMMIPLNVVLPLATLF